jgi:hypothetical protein
MPQKDFQIWLTDKIYLVVDYETMEGRIVSFAFRLMLIQNGSPYNVARYDTAHGTPHRDTLSRSNNILRVGKKLVDSNGLRLRTHIRH